ncbi:flavin reductase family protein [Oceanobacillus halophilus]|uniref:Flavin reductase n=1 Tax=Oceanobacillus halophilus TaxID=930130 RepID=A0A495ADP8_9BACI|nr:flavin reductase family protein [Oceanobacillus halophilus]RKQ38026.1 flavin reductase [Oceanobacillus halophilus]
MDDKKFREAMGKFATGVTVILTEEDGVVHGMTANAFMSVSLHPKLVTISIGEKTRILSKVKKSKEFTVNILASHQEELSRVFSGSLKDEWEMDFDRIDGKPALPGSIAQIACEVVSEYVEGDHTLFIGRVREVQLEEEDPLIFYNRKYRSLSEL